jgi:hypothetical protein
MNIPLTDYKFYSEQENHITKCAYSNPKIRVKCYTGLKEDIEEYMKMNSTKIKATYNATKRFKSLLTMINTNIKTNQKIIDWNEAQA